ncbi:hypothetical protein E7744_11760 [Citricoccus sp. SGAir0253]|uniref:hypothetical protein n=1 Tax=Citricoccus sp. SGAir0253 TaxID=2567881 RepID=UPI0010CD3FFC|nr:hypothetical protein [Citricoccus sp. SGAir0253]QCU78743.1 hypothetical protein E7744_11760 [Citricoccus sp. SGAir0253]
MSTSPRRTPADPELARYRSLRDALVWLAGMLVLTYLSSVLVLPWKVVSLGFALAGIAVGVLALVRTARIASPWVLRMAAAAGLVGCALFGFVAAAQVVFWDATTSFERCTDGALTERAVQRCGSEYAEHLGGIPGPAVGG